MAYYYADAETLEDGTIKPVGEIPPRVAALEYDANAARFVLVVHAESTPIPAEWTAKTAAEVETDYPGLLGGE